MTLGAKGNKGDVGVPGEPGTPGETFITEMLHLLPLTCSNTPFVLNVFDLKAHFLIGNGCRNLFHSYSIIFVLSEPGFPDGIVVSTN